MFHIEWGLGLFEIYWYACDWWKQISLGMSWWSIIVIVYFQLPRALILVEICHIEVIWLFRVHKFASAQRVIVEISKKCRFQSCVWLVLCQFIVIMLICRVVDESLSRKFPIFQQLTLNDLVIKLHFVSVIRSKGEFKYMVFCLRRRNWLIIVNNLC